MEITFQQEIMINKFKYGKIVILIMKMIYNLIIYKIKMSFKNSKYKLKKNKIFKK